MTRTMTRRCTSGLAAILLGIGFSSAAHADILDLGWYTIDGGGATFSTGGNFELGGTIGQPDAGVLTGGTFELSGGFWLAADANPCSGSVRGDSNCSGGVDFGDIDCFVAALIDESAWNSCGHAGGCDFNCVNDIDQNGSVNFEDIDGFVTCLINGGC